MTTEETRKKNLLSFPENLKHNISEIVDLRLNTHNQLLVIYYNTYKSNINFSFEHLCVLIENKMNIRINRIISKFRKTNEWDLKSIGERRTSYMIRYLLSAPINIIEKK